MPSNPRLEPIAIVGSGAAGLITAHTLLKDGFEYVEIITRDAAPGGVWNPSRVYPGLTINNVHGEFRFSELPMDPPKNSAETGGRLTGEDLRRYFQEFADTFLQGRIRFSTTVLNIKRDATQAPTPWLLDVKKEDDSKETLKYTRIVLCTGGCHTPRIPANLSLSASKDSNFHGQTIHSVEFGQRRKDILSLVPTDQTDAPSIVIVGGGKSAQDMAAYLASQGRRVTVVFETADSFLASKKPLPDFVRKSRLLSIFSPYIELQSVLEKFLHKTWIGSKIVNAFWAILQNDSFSALSVPKDSPLRNTHSVYWSCRVNDEGAPRDDSYFSLVNADKIELVAPARVTGYYEHGVILNNGNKLKADVVLLATGYDSSWKDIFDERTAQEIGLIRHEPFDNSSNGDWPYLTLTNPPRSHPAVNQPAASIYRGLVPAKNLFQRDFAINGAVFSTNNGYVFEVCAHWISSYLLGDEMHLPESVDSAVAHAERCSRFTRKRYPDQLLWLNESYSAAMVFLNWPSYIDELLRDMGLPGNRSGGNWIMKKGGSNAR